MTTIAFDGRIIACDSQATMGNAIVPGGGFRKLFPVEIDNGTKKPTRYVYCFAGTLALFSAAVHWHAAGADPTRQPIPLDDNSSFIVIEASDPNRPIVYEFTCVGRGHGLCLSAPITFGSGCDIAQTTLNLGHDAWTAVEQACAMDVFSSPPIEAFDVRKWKWVSKARPVPPNTADLRRSFKSGLREFLLRKKIEDKKFEKAATAAVNSVTKA